MADAMLQCSIRNPQSEIRNFSMPSFRRRHFLQLAAAGAFAASRPAFAAPPRIKIGQIGTGHGHASGKMETMRRSDEWEVVGIVEPDAGLRAAAEKSAAYAGLNWMTEEELLATSGLQ